jgi:hypothetical protein
VSSEGFCIRVSGFGLLDLFSTFFCVFILGLYRHLHNFDCKYSYDLPQTQPDPGTNISVVTLSLVAQQLKLVVNKKFVIFDVTLSRLAEVQQRF